MVLNYRQGQEKKTTTTVTRRLLLFVASTRLEPNRCQQRIPGLTLDGPCSPGSAPESAVLGTKLAASSAHMSTAAKHADLWLPLLTEKRSSEALSESSVGAASPLEADSAVSTESSALFFTQDGPGRLKSRPSSPPEAMAARLVVPAVLATSRLPFSSKCATAL